MSLCQFVSRTERSTDVARYPGTGSNMALLNRFAMQADIETHDLVFLAHA